MGFQDMAKKQLNGKDIEDNPDDLIALIGLLDQATRENKLSLYRPYPFQQEFHNAGICNTERMMCAANRVGKTMSAAAEVAMHLTGIYPDWFKGRKFKHPVLTWTASPTNETSRDIIQKELLGGVEFDLGTGMVPKANILGKPKMRQTGVKNVVETFDVIHKTGGRSECNLKTYEQGWKKFQGTQPHVIWLDEEPDDYMIFTECLTRTLTSKGIILVTFTPLQGMTELVEHFMTGGKGIYIKNVTWDDATHLDEEEKERLKASFPSYQVDARTKGIPMLGEGAVFPVSEDNIKIDPFEVPKHWARVKGCDFGIDHPAAGAEIAWDKDADIIYLIDCYKASDQTSVYHAAWFNKANPLIPVAWPHDGVNREKSGGDTIAAKYREHGANMMKKSARYPKKPGEKKEKGGSQPVEPIVEELLERMLTGRFKVFSNLNAFFEEKRNYHRKDGRIVAKRDDILKAVFYAVMMKRYAIPLTRLNNSAFTSRSPAAAHISASIR